MVPSAKIKASDSISLMDQESSSDSVVQAQKVLQLESISRNSNKKILKRTLLMHLRKSSTWACSYPISENSLADKTQQSSHE